MSSESLVEVWDPVSGNMLLSAPLEEVLAWLRSYRAENGAEAAMALSIGPEDDSWLATGPDLLERLTP